MFAMYHHIDTALCHQLPVNQMAEVQHQCYDKLNGAVHLSTFGWQRFVYFIQSTKFHKRLAIHRVPLDRLRVGLFVCLFVSSLSRSDTRC